MLLAKASMRESRCIKWLISIFLFDSGLSLSHSKYDILFFNTSIRIQMEIPSLLNFHHDSLPSKYLGTPLTATFTNHGAWSLLIQKMEKHIANWSFRSLNIASWLVLLNFVLRSMSTYVVSIFNSPKRFLNEICALQCTFLCSGFKTKGH